MTELGSMRSLRLAVPLSAFALLVLATLVGPVVWPVDPYGLDFGAMLAPPSLAHPMGTDDSGRDILARFLSGGRLSLAVGLVVMLGGLVFGTLAGWCAASFGRFADTALMRVMDSIAAFPPILLAMAIAIGLGGGLVTAVVGVTVSTLPFFARLMRGEVLRIRALPFVTAAEAMGGSRLYILLRHLAPHAASTMLIQAAAVFGYAILTLAGLGFVGLGAAIPTAEWGLMITDGMKYAMTGGWWLTVFPGLGVVIASVCANSIADALANGLRGSDGGRT